MSLMCGSERKAAAQPRQEKGSWVEEPGVRKEPVDSALLWGTSLRCHGCW